MKRNNRFPFASRQLLRRGFHSNRYVERSGILLNTIKVRHMRLDISLQSKETDTDSGPLTSRVVVAD